MNILIRKMEKRDADQLAHLKEVVFPDLIPEERIITSFHPWHVFRYLFIHHPQSSHTK